jgi:hypothetical protein
MLYAMIFFGNERCPQNIPMSASRLNSRASIFHAPLRAEHHEKMSKSYHFLVRTDFRFGKSSDRVSACGITTSRVERALSGRYGVWFIVNLKESYHVKET